MNEAVSSASELIGGSLAKDVLHRLREDIMSCVLKPGTRLRFDMLRKVYAASYSTLREALSSLASENLVVAESQRGYSVAPVSQANLVDLTNVRVLVEREAARLSIENGDDDWEDTILTLYHRLDRMERRHGEGYAQNPAWVQMHREFHLALLSACGSATLLSIHASLFGLSHRYRRLYSAIRESGRSTRPRVEHRALMEAFTQRRVGEAQDLIEGHIRQTAEGIIAHLGK